jgi:hypothetical protein
MYAVEIDSGGMIIQIYEYTYQIHNDWYRLLSIIMVIIATIQEAAVLVFTNASNLWRL